MELLTPLFVVALAVTTAVRLWLAARQLAAVRAHRETVPAPFAAAIPLDDHRRAADYTAANVRFGRVRLVWDAALLLLVTLGGGFAALDAGVARLGLSAPWHGVAVLVALGALLSILHLPFAWYDTFRLEARFGFNRTTPRLWLADLLRGTLLALALAVPLLALLLWLAAAAGPLWWLWAWVAWAAFALGLNFAYPRFIAPLFNAFRPLEGELRNRIEALLARCGFASEGVFLMDGSRRSSHGNAYFAGFGRLKRIVLFDTLVERLGPAEIEAVLAHELGHYRLRHVAQRLALSLVTTLAGFALLGWLHAQPGFHAAFGVPVPSSHATLALFVLAAPVFTFALDPLGSWWSRRHEFEADAFAARHADGAALADALVKLYRDNASTLTPDRLYSAWHDSHPPALARIGALARRAAPVPSPSRAAG